MTIDYQKDKDSLDLNSSDDPRPEFPVALAALVPDVYEVLGDMLKAPKLKNDEEHPMTILGIDIDNAKRRVAYSAKVKLAGLQSPCNINTPAVRMDPPDEEIKGMKFLSQEALGRVETAIAEATKYLDGDRAQGELPIT